jgi:hypothetical protein
MVDRRRLEVLLKMEVRCRRYQCKSLEERAMSKMSRL